MKTARTLSTTFLIALGLATATSADRLTLLVDTASAQGSVRAAVFSSAQAFKDNTVTIGANAAAQKGETELEFKNLKPGSYGIALFHDLDGNEKLDRNLLGAPNEPFGFSGNPKIGFSAPKFDAFKFEYDGTATVLRITLNGG